MVRAPLSSTRIADIDECPPPSRTQPAVSMCSSARLARMRSPIASSPSGPAKLTRPPNRAIATAALAAQPPPTAMNSLASPLLSTGGTDFTRYTSSSTTMPAQRMRGASRSTNARSLDPGANDVVRDRDRRRGGEPLGVRLHQHGGGLVTREPARVLELGCVDLDVDRQRLRMRADHQRHRERPGLGGEIADIATDNAGLLKSFPTHRVLDGFAGLDEPGEARPHAGTEACLPSEQATVAVDRQHDRHRVGAR